MVIQTCAVIVTYGERYHFLARVIDALIQEKIDRIIVVDNNSCESSKDQLLLRESSLKGLLNVITLDNNTGSAGGYKAGLERAYLSRDCDFIWLLDDDNEPRKGALEALKLFWSKAVKPEKKNVTCLLSFRESRLVYKILSEQPFDDIIGDKNAFMKFNVLNIFNGKMIRTLLGRETRAAAAEDSHENGRLPFAPYGGMFFHKSLIDAIGFPDERFYLYCDDFDFSHRIIKIKGEIILVLNSIITDLETGGTDDDSDIVRFYYRTRNLIYFRQKLVTNKMLYTINRLLFWSLFKTVKTLGLIFKKENKQKTRIMLSAIQDGFREKLGKCENLF